MPISEAAIRAIKPTGKRQKLGAGQSLFLWVQPNGSLLWRYHYRFNGFQKVLPLGSYPLVKLAEARLKRDDARRQLLKGIDPCAARKVAKLELAAQCPFSDLVTDYLDLLARKKRADVTIEKARWVLAKISGKLGNISANDITPPMVLAAIKPIEAAGRFETANRAKSTVGAVFRYAMAMGRATTDPTIALKEVLQRPQAERRAAITSPAKLGVLLSEIDCRPGEATVTAALKLLPLVFVRPGELRFAKWSEFDFCNAEWKIPAERMKMRKPLRVPLSRQALSILKQVKELGIASEYVFPSHLSPEKPISENTLNQSLRRLGYSKEEVTAHGFRATALSMLSQSNKWSRDAIDLQLAHLEQSSVRGRYARHDCWDERVKMMAWWGNHLATLKQATTGIRSNQKKKKNNKKNKNNN